MCLESDERVATRIQLSEVRTSYDGNGWIGTPTSTAEVRVRIGWTWMCCRANPTVRGADKLRWKRMDRDTNIDCRGARQNRMDVDVLSWVHRQKTAHSYECRAD